MSRAVIATLILMMATVLVSCGADQASEQLAADDGHWFNVSSGADAIAAAQGEPHILWFWGAN